MVTVELLTLLRISIHSPRMGRDGQKYRGLDREGNFNPLSPHGERLPPPYSPGTGWGFQSTLPAWGETGSSALSSSPALFQSTLPAWGETTPPSGAQKDPKISIHSPRMGRDQNRNAGKERKTISIHSPRMGRDMEAHQHGDGPLIFQSTLPAWGETNHPGMLRGGWADFNPLSPHGERPNRSVRTFLCYYFNPLSPHGERQAEAREQRFLLLISIHSPRMGRDPPHRKLHFRPNIFQSTLPAWGETLHRLYYNNNPEFQSTLPAWGETGRCFPSLLCVVISIHSPRMGRDFPVFPCFGQLPAFQSTLPAWGETICNTVPSVLQNEFQSTLPAWGETPSCPSRRPRWTISIHSPRMGRDTGKKPWSGTRFYFNPLSPHGERQVRLSARRRRRGFQSTLPAWGETRPTRATRERRGISIHSPRMGRDPATMSSLMMGMISIHSPRMGRDEEREEVPGRVGKFQSTLPAWGETVYFTGD